MEQLDRDCEKYRGGPSVAYAERLHATIDHRGKIFINRRLHKQMGAPQAVYLYFNRKKDMIVVEPTQCTSSSESFVMIEANNGGRVVYSNPFCKNFNIRPEGTQRFIAPETDAIGRLYLKLAETVLVTRGPRKKRQNRER